MDKGELAHLARPGAEIAVRATPRAGRNAVELGSAGLAVRVTAPAEGGKANDAVRSLLARALGLPKSRLQLVRGEKTRNKVFRVLE